MAIQLAYYRIHKKFVLTYESATTRSISAYPSIPLLHIFFIIRYRMFYKGRTETIRPISDFSCKFARLCDDPSAKDEEKKDALKRAIE